MASFNRNRRSRGVPRAHSISMRIMRREHLRRGAQPHPSIDEPRPLTRGDCVDAARPCPWALCKYHLYLDVDPRTGSLKLNFPALEPWELEQTCALDIADQGGVTLEIVGNVLNVTRERSRQIELRALHKLKAADLLADLGVVSLDGFPHVEQGFDTKE